MVNKVSLEALFLRSKAGRRLQDKLENEVLAESDAKRLAAHDAHLSKAKIFRAQGRTKDSLTRFRRALLANPLRVQTWVDYGFEAIKAQRISLAHEAFINALELDPSNVMALEMAADTTARLGLPATEVKRLAYKAGKDLHDKPHRHLDILEILYPYGTNTANEAIEVGANKKAKALLALSLSPQSNIEDVAPALNPRDQQDIMARFCLLQGRYSQADKLLSRIPREELPTSALRRVAKRQAQIGRHHNVLLVTKFMLRADPDDAWARNKYAASEREYRNSKAAEEKRLLLKSGYPFPPLSGTKHAPTSNSVLYLLHNSLPFSSAGYATRSHGLIKNIFGQGYEIAGVTRPGFPFDRPEAKHDGSAIESLEHVDGIPYYRLSTSAEKLQKYPLVPYIKEYSQRLERLARERRSSLIHAASNHWNGLAAVTAAKRLGIPSVYEVRGLWEITRISREPEWKGSIDYDFMAAMEAEAALGATHVLAITSAIRDELISRGVPAEKIDIVPNGVDTSRFVPRPPNIRLKSDLGISDKTVIGYVGSILDYEGIGTLIDAARILESAYDSFHVLIVGDGDYLDNAKARAAAAGLSSRITFTGRVPHEDVEDYYSIIDIAPIPRHALPVTEMVSPLKPFEAMAMGKVVVGSNVAAIDEIIEEGINGLTFQKDSSSRLAATLERLLAEPEKIASLGASARLWVESERDWSHIAKRVTAVYDMLLGSEL